MIVHIIAFLLAAVVLPEQGSKVISSKDMRACQHVRQPARAMKACSRLIDKNSLKSARLRVKIYTRRGQAFALLKQYSKAEADFSKAIQLQSDYTEAYFHRGAVRSRMGKHGKAIADYSTVIERKPVFAMPYYNRGTAYVRQKKYAHAIADFSTMIGLRPRFWRAYINRGAIYSKTGKVGKALYDYDIAYKINPNKHSILINRAALNVKVGRYRYAYDDYMLGLKMSNNHNHVTEIQKTLKKKGFLSGSLTGLFDGKTQNALKQWLLNNKGKSNGDAHE